MKELLLKYINGDCTDQEKVTIVKWLDSDPANMKEYAALRKLNDITIWQTTPCNKQRQKSKEHNSNRTWKKYYIGALKIAAVFLSAILISQYLLPEIHLHKAAAQKTVTAMQTLRVPAGQRAELIMEDGTKVWLNANTTLTFPSNFSKETREVVLDGEGFFDVTPDKAKPFIVNTSEYNVRVWGTKFNLKAYSEKGTFETSLLEGSVEIIKPGQNNGVMMKPNERVYLKDGRMFTAQISNMDHFLWKDGILSFNNASFSELVEQLELYFDMEIEVKNNKILDYHCTGKFRTKDGVEHILKVLQLKNKFRYKIDDKLNKIIIE